MRAVTVKVDFHSITLPAGKNWKLVLVWFFLGSNNEVMRPGLRKRMFPVPLAVGILLCMEQGHTLWIQASPRPSKSKGVRLFR